MRPSSPLGEVGEREKGMERVCRKWKMMNQGMKRKTEDEGSKYCINKTQGGNLEGQACESVLYIHTYIHRHKGKFALLAISRIMMGNDNTCLQKVRNNRLGEQREGIVGGIGWQEGRDGIGVRGNWNGGR